MMELAAESWFVGLTMHDLHAILVTTLLISYLILAQVLREAAGRFVLSENPNRVHADSRSDGMSGERGVSPDHLLQIRGSEKKQTVRAVYAGNARQVLECLP